MNFPFQERKREQDLFRDVFKNEQGKDLLAILAKSFHVYKTAQTPDPYISAFQEGQRSVVMKIIEIVETDLEAVKRRMDQQEAERLKRRQ
tara:strand:+ start:193 stop:462 length:270 start_codon:yes stop_codon:yes gene_type:complete